MRIPVVRSSTLLFPPRFLPFPSRALPNTSSFILPPMGSPSAGRETVFLFKFRSIRPLEVPRETRRSREGRASHYTSRSRSLVHSNAAAS